MWKFIPDNEYRLLLVFKSFLKWDILTPNQASIIEQITFLQLLGVKNLKFKKFFSLDKFWNWLIRRTYIIFSFYHPNTLAVNLKKNRRCIMQKLNILIVYFFKTFFEIEIHTASALPMSMQVLPQWRVWQQSCGCGQSDLFLQLFSLFLQTSLDWVSVKDGQIGGRSISVNK